MNSEIETKMKQTETNDRKTIENVRMNVSAMHTMESAANAPIK